MPACRCLTAAALFTCLMWAVGDVQADLFHLANGATVRGRLLNESQTPRTNYVVKTSAGLIVSLAKGQVERFEPATEAEVAYERLLPEMPDTVDGNWAMARWCLEQKLDDIREHHLEEVLRHDPDHREARLALGYTTVGGRWVKTADWNRQHGYVYYKSSWRTPHEVATLKAAEQVEELEVDWRRKLKTWQRNLTRNREVAATLADIRAVKHPLAGPILSELYEDDNGRPDLRRIWIEALGKNPAGVASDTLVQAAVGDPDEGVRELARDMLAERKDGRSIGALLAELKSKDNLKVNRAGSALGRIEDPQTLLPLIDALNTEHKFIIQRGRPGNTGATFSPNGNGPTNFQAGSSTKVVTQEFQNSLVRDALIVVAQQVVPGQQHENYGFDEEAWKEWYAGLGVPVGEVNLRRDE